VVKTEERCGQKRRAGWSKEKREVVKREEPGGQKRRAEGSKEMITSGQKR